MPVQPGTIICRKCGEDRPTLIHEINDPRGQRYVCMVCSFEFRVTSSELSSASGK
jgi:transposase-like protein